MCLHMNQKAYMICEVELNFVMKSEELFTVYIAFTAESCIISQMVLNRDLLTTGH